MILRLVLIAVVMLAMLTPWRHFTQRGTPPSGATSATTDPTAVDNNRTAPLHGRYVQEDAPQRVFEFRLGTLTTLESGREVREQAYLQVGPRATIRGPQPEDVILVQQDGRLRLERSGQPPVTLRRE